MKAEPPPLEIGTPCPRKWGDMTGDAKRRFCEHCQLHVHNLSAMPSGERMQFVAETRGRACITYELRPDGTMVTASRWDWMLRPLRAVGALLAAILPFAFSSCGTRRTVGVPMPPRDVSAQSAQQKLGRVQILGEAMPVKKPAERQ